MAWCFTDEATEFTKALLRDFSNLTDGAVVLALWLYEVVNVIQLSAANSPVAQPGALRNH